MYIPFFIKIRILLSGNAFAASIADCMVAKSPLPSLATTYLYVKSDPYRKQDTLVKIIISSM